MNDFGVNLFQLEISTNQLKLKKMKKVFLTLALVFATSTVLVSCGGDASDDASAATEEGTDEMEGEEEGEEDSSADATADAE